MVGVKKDTSTDFQVEKLNATGRLLRALAHEVRNPLNNMLLSVEQLNAEIKTDDSKIYLDIINRNCKRISELITDLLDSALQPKIAFEKLSLQFIVNESIEAAAEKISFDNVVVEKDYAEEELYVMGDAEKLKVAFKNILINAVEAMKNKEGNLHISIQNKPNGYTVSITDNGCGINEENIVRIFEPNCTSKRNGMGIGLTCTLNIVRTHNASINVKSKIDKGSTFLVTLEKVL